MQQPWRKWHWLDTLKKKMFFIGDRKLLVKEIIQTIISVDKCKQWRSLLIQKVQHDLFKGANETTNRSRHCRRKLHHLRMHFPFLEGGKGNKTHIEKWSGRDSCALINKLWRNCPAVAKDKTTFKLNIKYNVKTSLSKMVKCQRTGDKRPNKCVKSKTKASLSNQDFYVLAFCHEWRESWFLLERWFSSPSAACFTKATWLFIRTLCQCCYLALVCTRAI